MNHTRAIILAAGRSSRMGRSKALLRIQGNTFVERIAQVYRDIGVPTTIVTNQEDRESLADLELGQALVLVNSNPETGPLASLLIGMESIADDTSGIVPHPVDHPLVGKETILGLLRAHESWPDSIILPENRGDSGHPVLFPARLFPMLRAAPLSEGARWVVRNNPAAVRNIAVDDEGIHQNIDSPEAYSRWIGKTPQES